MSKNSLEKKAKREKPTVREIDRWLVSIKDEASKTVDIIAEHETDDLNKLHDVLVKATKLGYKPSITP